MMRSAGVSVWETGLRCVGHALLTLANDPEPELVHHEDLSLDIVPLAVPVDNLVSITG